MGEAHPVAVVADAERPDRSRLLLRGRVTVASAARLREAALAAVASGRDVTVDCAAAEHLDVSALQILIALGREVFAAGRQCDVAGVPPAVAELFRLAGLGGAG